MYVFLTIIFTSRKKDNLDKIRHQPVRHYSAVFICVYMIYLFHLFSFIRLNIPIIIMVFWLTFCDYISFITCYYYLILPIYKISFIDCFRYITNHNILDLYLVFMPSLSSKLCVSNVIFRFYLKIRCSF